MTREYVCLANRSRRFASTIVQITAAVLCFYVFLPTAYSQDPGQLIECSGSVEPASLGAVAIEIASSMGVSYRANVDGSGFFRIQLPAGDYRGRIIGPYGNTIDYVDFSARRPMTPLVFRMAEPAREPIGGGTVSARVLQHKIPGKAREEFDTATRDVQKSDLTAAVGHLQKAVAIDPEFMEAHRRLGVLYVSSSRYEAALAEFQKALQMDPHNSRVYAHMAAAYIGLRNPAQAEKEARRSIELDGRNGQAHYMLALAIYSQKGITPEVENNLRAAADTLPEAHLVLGRILLARGEKEQSAQELRAYLATGHEQGRAQAQAWLAGIHEDRKP
jgi:Tfp pilus assembly protein PilF